LAKEKRYYVYILASKSRILYVGIAGFLMARVLQHKSGETEGFTKKYRIDRRVYYESFRTKTTPLPVKRKSRSAGAKRRSPSQ
jgi:putative endonuclease